MMQSTVLADFSAMPFVFVDGQLVEMDYQL